MSALRSGVAAELLAQRRERRVVGEGATRGALGREGVARGAGVELRLGLLGREDLLLVGLPAQLGGRVLGLPGVALGLEALEPLARGRVEALGVLVVALLVVLGDHAVERGEARVELGVVRVDALVGLLEAQRDAATVE